MPPSGWVLAVWYTDLADGQSYEDLAAHSLPGTSQRGLRSLLIGRT